MRALIISLAMFLVPLCSFSASFNSPFAATDPTPTAEVAALPTFTPVSYYGTVIPDSSLANIRGCRIVSDTLCPVVMKLRPGDTPLRVIDISDPEWLKVEIPEHGQAWVVRYVVIHNPVN
jgi:hypothetical protein